MQQEIKPKFIDEERKTPEQIAEERVREMQRVLYGKRYEGVSISKIRAPEWAQLKILNWIENPKNFLIFIGTPGAGKTHLCASFTEYAMKFESFRYYNEGQLLTKVRNSIDQCGGDCLTNLKGFIDDFFVMIDDIGSGKINEWREEILFEAINYRYNIMLPTVITSNFSKQDFERNYHPRIASRLFSEENTIIDASEWPDLRKEPGK